VDKAAELPFKTASDMGHWFFCGGSCILARCWISVYNATARYPGPSPLKRTKSNPSGPLIRSPHKVDPITSLLHWRGRAWHPMASGREVSADHDQRGAQTKFWGKLPIQKERA
jgi:hypothetical protein